VGGQLVADPGTWEPTATISYQWYANAKKISGATRQSYRPTPGRVGAQVQVRVKATRPGYTTVYVKSVAVVVVAA